MSVTGSIASILSEIRRPRSEAFKQGLLPAYRTIALAQLVLGMAFYSIVAAAPTDPMQLEVSAKFGWLVLLAIYLFWPNLHIKLGRWFLPIALIINSFFPLVDRQITLAELWGAGGLDVLPREILALSSCQVMIFLLFPAVFAAWQYGRRGLAVYTIGVTVADLLLVGMFFNWTGLSLGIALVLVIARDIILVLVGILVLQLLDSEEEQRRRLSDANQKLATYAATADQLATSRERNRLARELHDTLAHTLSSLSVQLEAADSVWKDAPDQAHNLLVKSIANARSGLAETRRALQDLRASPLEDLGLGLALRNLAESTAKRAGMKLVLEVPKQIEGLTDEQEQGIYRIAQEALENVAKHSRASQFRLCMQKAEESQWQLLVCDNGRGFVLNSLSENGHFGFQGMNERALMLGGTLVVQSSAGAGTEVRLAL